MSKFYNSVFYSSCVFKLQKKKISVLFSVHPYNGGNVWGRNTHINIIHTSIMMFNNFHNLEKQLDKKFADEVVSIL